MPSVVKDFQTPRFELSLFQVIQVRISSVDNIQHFQLDSSN
jgi:hypothetical protein